MANVLGEQTARFTFVSTPVLQDLHSAKTKIGVWMCLYNLLSLINSNSIHRASSAPDRWELTLVALRLAARHGFRPMLRWCRLRSSGHGVAGLRLVRRQILHAETPQSLRQDALALGKVRVAADCRTLAVVLKGPYYIHSSLVLVLYRSSWLSRGEVLINKAALGKYKYNEYK